MKRLKIIFICKLTICLLTWSVFVAELDAVRGSAVVLQARAKADKKNSDQDETIDVDENGEQIELNVTTTAKPTLTGIPQIDYVHDPNLPRELNGYNLTDYPFLNSVPEEIDFKCDGLHDGFYASMPHKCQLYHHCLFGTRFDFLCANYTAFDQKTFICHFVSQVDCPNSAKYYNRNEALYKTAETTTLSTTTTSTSPLPQLQQQQPYYPQYQQQQYQPQQQFQPQQQQQQQIQPQQQQFQLQQQQMPYEGRRAMAPGYAQGRKRRPTYRRRRPVYEYYYVDDYDDQQDYYDESVEPMPVIKKPIRKHSRFNNYKPTDLDVDYLESSSESDVPPSGNYKNNRGQQQQHQQHLQPLQQQQQHQQQQQPQPPQQYQQQQQRQQSTAVTKNASNQITSVYDKPRAPPKIRRPVPINERDRYDYTSASSKTSGQQQSAVVQAIPVPTTTTTTTTTEAPTTTAKSASKSAKEQQRLAVTEEPIEYYDEDEEELPAEDEYVAEPEVPAAKPAAAVKPAAAAAVVAKPAAAAASKPELVRAAARTAVVADYDGDHRGRRPSPPVQASRPRASSPRVVVPLPVVQPPQPAVPRKRPTADDYEDELPAAATRQSIAAATKQRASGPFVSRPIKARAPQPPPAAAADAVEYEGEEPEAAAYQPLPVQQQQQQTRKSQRVSVREVTAAQHRPRPQQQTSVADHPRAQFNNNHNGNKFVRAASASNRRPAAAVRPVYEYADEYYDE